MNSQLEQEGDNIDGHTGQGPALGAGAQGGVIQGSGQGGDNQGHQGNRNLSNSLLSIILISSKWSLIVFYSLLSQQS